MSASTPSTSAKPRWFALINDRIYTVPRQNVPVSLLRVFAGIPADESIVRDYQSPNDVALPDGSTVDLAEGNVFVTKQSVHCTGTAPSAAPAKMALALDDCFELIPIAEFDLATLRSLFGANDDTKIQRDLESPNDEPIQSGSVIRFKDGPTFISCGCAPKHLDVSIVTTAGAFPAEEFERLPINQTIKVQLVRAARALQLGDVSDWIARHGTRELNIEQSYHENDLSGQVEIDYGRREGGGGVTS